MSFLKQLQTFSARAASAYRNAPEWAKAALWLAVGALIWWRSSTVLQDILVFCSLIWVAIWRRDKLRVWLSPAGLGFALLAIHLLIMLPFSTHPNLSFKDLTRQIDLIAGAIAIPALFNNPRRMKNALFFSAGAMAIGFGYDMLRLGFILKGELLTRAHSYEPFLQNHSNVASMMAGAAVFVFFYLFWNHRGNLCLAIAGLAGMALSLAYLIVLASRGPQIAFAATCCLPGFLTASRKKKLLWSVIIVIGGALLFLFAGAINPRMLEKNTMRTFTERTVVWTHTQALARERPIMGYGYGKRIFKKTYYESNPPKSPFVYPHCHQYWLKLRFEFGWPGLALYFAVWTLLAVSLWRHIARLDSFDERLLPGAIGIILIFIHIYGLGDYPDNVVEIMLYSAAAAAVGVLAMPPEKQRSMAELPETHAQ